MKKLLLSLIIIIASTIEVVAQNEVDALRFSRIQYGGSARYWGLGGAFGAVGADFSSVSTNPAGMGLYKRSEISFTPYFEGTKIASTFNGTYSDDTKSKLDIGSIGAVFVIDNPDSRTNKDWKNFQFGFGYNRLANFNANYYITGTNPKTSLLGDYVNSANGTAPADLGVFDTKLAFDANLLFRPNTNTNIYSADILGVSPFPGIGETKSISTNGYMGETVFAGSANFQDRIYFGASLGILSLKYEESSNYTETDNGDKIPLFNSFTKYDYQIIKGTGINLKLGVIVRATDWLRVGAAFHTPSLFSKLNIDYTSSISSQFSDNTLNSNQDSPLGTYTFDLVTPMKFIGSAAFVIGKTGLISADYEMVDYSKARLRPSSDFTNENQRIQDKYTSTSNFRIGGEYRYGQINFRAGLGIFGSPYKMDVNNGKGTLASLGLGYRTSNYFIDCAFTNYNMNEDYYLYGTDPANKASLKTTNNVFMITFGLKF
ncbi:MAG: hypothetical protein Q8908_04165 [Bacteroidota bacterium]|nr:hypothetical protein [Bacteroidota bacterium]